MIRLSRETLSKNNLKSGGETLGSPKPPITTSGRGSCLGCSRISCTALSACAKVTANAGLSGLATQAVNRNGIERMLVMCNTISAPCLMLISFLDLELLKGERFTAAAIMPCVSAARQKLELAIEAHRAGKLADA